MTSRQDGKSSGSMFSLSMMMVIVIFMSRSAIPIYSEVPDVPIETVVGSVEMVYLDPPERWYRGRVDTGAALCSLNAYSVTEFDKDGALWVRFNMATLLDDEDVFLELPVERVVLVRQGSREDLQKRYIVLLRIRLGPLEQEREFSLSDRRNMTYPVLIGRNFLAGNALVDVSKEFIYR